VENGRQTANSEVSAKGDVRTEQL